MQLNFTIPKTTPPGKYLARVEHFFIQSIYNTTQQYINCAHIEVVGPGGGKPGPMVKFPGAYSLEEPGGLCCYFRVLVRVLIRGRRLATDGHVG